MNCVLLSLLVRIRRCLRLLVKTLSVQCYLTPAQSCPHPSALASRLRTPSWLPEGRRLRMSAHPSPEVVPPWLWSLLRSPLSYCPCQRWPGSFGGICHPEPSSLDCLRMHDSWAWGCISARWGGERTIPLAKSTLCFLFASRWVESYSGRPPRRTDTETSLEHSSCKACTWRKNGETAWILRQGWQCWRSRCQLLQYLTLKFRVLWFDYRFEYGGAALTRNRDFRFCSTRCRLEKTHWAECRNQAWE